MMELYGGFRFYRHVASHWIEMQQAMIAMVIGGVFEFHPKLRVGFLEAQNSWVPGLLSRIEWDYPQYRDSHAPYLSLTPREYFRRNCWPAASGRARACAPGSTDAAATERLASYCRRGAAAGAWRGSRR